jgi:hypothetical protein
MTDDVTSIPSIRYFSKQRLIESTMGLSENSSYHQTNAVARRRFAALFEAKPKWTLEEILPFVNDLAEGTERKVGFRVFIGDRI